jgi:hypothetical protein
MINYVGNLAQVYASQGIPAISNGAGITGFFDCVTLNVLGDQGQGLIDINKKTFRIITGSIPNIVVNQSTITFNGCNYKIIGASAVGDGLETDLNLQSI